MDTNTIPHEEIRQRKDRSWTFKLLDMIMQSSHDDNLFDIAHSLGELDDPRVITPLLSIVQDLNQPGHIRNAVCISLGAICTGCDENDRRRWWNSGDEVLRRLAVLVAKSSDADFVIPVARDREHQFHYEAIDRLQFGFVEPEYQHLLIEALKHPDATVRKVAAHHLVWEEPIEAETSLIRALYDVSDDVAGEALFSISYFSNQMILRGLAEASTSAPERRRSDVAGVLGACQDAFKRAYRELTGDSQKYLLKWLKPIENLIDLSPPFDSEDDCEEKPHSCRCHSGTSEPKYLLQNVEQIIEFFEDVDGCWYDKQSWRFECDWKSYCDFDRLRLADYLANHHDHAVREIACEPFGIWNRGDLLAKFLEDACFGVRKRAAYYLKEVNPNPAFVPILWKSYTDVDCVGFSREALEAFVLHSHEDGLEDILLNIALTERRTSRREEAIDQLRNLNAHKHMQEVLPLLGQAPLVNWNVHRSLVDYCYEQEIEVPHFAELAEIDDLQLQETLALALPFQRTVSEGKVSYATELI